MFGECHGHIFMNGCNYKQAAQLYKNGPVDQDIRRKLENYRQAGITFYRDGGDHYGASVRARQFAEEYGIDYRTPVYGIHKKGTYGSIVGREFSDLREYRELVEEVKRQNGDFIKIMLSGIMDFETDGHVTGLPLNKNEIKEMISIAHDEGYAVMAHVNGAETIQAAAEAGVDSIEHGNFMNDQCLAVLKDTKAIWVPTHVTIANLIGTGRFQDQVIERLRKLQAGNIVKAIEMGIPVALGSDAGAFGVPHVQGIRDEYRCLSELFPEKKQQELDSLFAGAEKAIKKIFKR